MSTFPLAARVSSGRQAVLARATNSSFTNYAGGVNGYDFSGTGYRIWKAVNSTKTSLAYVSAPTMQVGDIVRLEVQGSNLTLKVNGSTLLTATDTAIASGDPGIYARSDAAIAPIFDNWSGGALNPSLAAGASCTVSVTFTPSATGPRSGSFAVPASVTNVQPPYPLLTIRSNTLSYTYNAPFVLGEMQFYLSTYRTRLQPDLTVAVTQGDVIGHSMGGLVTRQLPLLLGFGSDDTFGRGVVHKLITIGTPHLGTPIAQQLLDPANQCIAGVLAFAGKLSISSATVNGTAVDGAVADLEGDGTNPGAANNALKNLQAPQSYFPIAIVAGLATQTNLAGLDCGLFCTPTMLKWLACRHHSPLADDLSSSGWPAIFSQQNSDTIVPLTSQMPVSNGKRFVGVIHSNGLLGLDFVGPAELDSQSGIPQAVIDLLNEPINGLDFNKM